MSDDHPSTGDGDGTSDGTTGEPGGGPERVVSETSVDDILDSLNETKTAASDDSETSTESADDSETASDGADDAETTADSIAEPTATDDAALADRIEQGTVTGADVRTAEAGEGREKTPEIDEVELTMDDLEATESTTGSGAGSTATTDDLDDDAGPLAGTIGPDSTDANSDDDDETTDSDDDSAGGVFARLKRLFFG